MLPMAVAAGLDERMLRGVGVWIKPMKFALSIAVLALTTTWFAGHLPAAQRRGRAMSWIVWLLIGAGSCTGTRTWRSPRPIGRRCCWASC